jgi:hypothetical protein
LEIGLNPGEISAMMGMEMMLAKMIGLTPDQMKAKAAEFEAMVKGASDALVSIAANQKRNS